MKMSVLKSFLLRVIIYFPFIFMLIMLIVDPWQYKTLISYSGYFSVSFLVITLLLNPLKTLNPQWVWVIKLNRYRRDLGIASFLYAFLHVICFYLKRHGFVSFLKYLVHYGIIPAFWVALPILFMLTLTSNKYSIKKLKFENWKKLHKMVYIAEWAIFFHMIILHKTKWALLLFIPLMTFQYIRRIKLSKAAPCNHV